jgi:hypothetical protein
LLGEAGRAALADMGLPHVVGVPVARNHQNADLDFLAG